jgi:hypothetical protein
MAAHLSPNLLQSSSTPRRRGRSSRYCSSLLFFFPLISSTPSA